MRRQVERFNREAELAVPLGLHVGINAGALVNQGTVDFGGGAIVAVATDLFLARFGAAGAHLWSLGWALVFCADDDIKAWKDAFQAAGALRWPEGW